MKVKEYNNIGVTFAMQSFQMRKDKYTCNILSYKQDLLEQQR